MKKLQNTMLMSWAMLITLMISTIIGISSSMMAFASPNGDKRGNQIAAVSESEISTEYYLENSLEQKYDFSILLHFMQVKELKFTKEAKTLYFDKYEVVPSTEAIGEYQPATGTREGYSLKTNFTQAGKYYVKIKGYYHTNPEIVHIQTVRIDVKQNNENCGSVEGRLFFKPELPYPGDKNSERVTVVFTRVGAAEYDPVNTPAELVGKHYFIVKSDELDRFSMDIPAGRYTVRYLCPEMNVDVYEQSFWGGEKSVYQVVSGEKAGIVAFVIEPDPEQMNTTSEVNVNVALGGDNIFQYENYYNEIIEQHLKPMIDTVNESVSFFHFHDPQLVDPIGEYMPIGILRDKDGRLFYRLDSPGKFYFKVVGYPQGTNGKIYKSHTLIVKINAEAAKPLCATVKGKFILPQDISPEVAEKTVIDVKLVKNVLTDGEKKLIDYPQFDGRLYFTGKSNNELNFSVNVPEGDYKMLYTCDLLNVKSQYANASGEAVINANCENATDLGDIVISTAQVVDTNRVAKIIGTVSVENPADLPYITVYAVPTDDNPVKLLLPKIRYVAERTKEMTARFSWKIDVPVGNYKVYAKLNNTVLGGTYELYADTENTPQAKFEFKTEETPKYSAYTIKARVYDAQTNEVQRAFLSVLPVGVGTDGLAGISTGAYTMEDGYAIFKLPYEFINDFGNNPVIVKLCMHASGYIPQYYNNVYNLADAQEILLDSNYDNNTIYNFPMQRNQEVPIYKHKIIGTLKNGDTPVAGLINLIKKTEGNQTNYKFYNAPTMNNGSFEFNDVKPGKYMLFAVPLQGQVMPGFYREGNVASSIWEEATEIVIAENANEAIVKQCNIALAPIAPNNGSGKIAGKVAANTVSGKVMAGITSSDQALNNAFMTVVDENGKAVRNCNTGNDGKFSFENLLPGTYKVSASIYGYKSLVQTITIGKSAEDQNFEGALFVLDKAMSDVQDAKAEVSVYPNPAKAMINIDFQAQAGNATISISDALGNMVFSNNIATTDGANNYKYNTQSMPNGLYVITITLDNGKTISSLLNIVK